MRVWGMKEENTDTGKSIIGKGKRVRLKQKTVCLLIKNFLQNVILAAKYFVKQS